MRRLLLVCFTFINLVGCVSNNIAPLKHEWLTYRESLKSWNRLPKNQYHEVLPVYNDNALKLLKKRKITQLTKADTIKYTGEGIHSRKNAYLVRALTCKFNKTGGLSVYSNTVTKKLAIQYSAFGNCHNILKKAVVVFLGYEPVDLFVELSLGK